MKQGLQRLYVQFMLAFIALEEPLRNQAMDEPKL
jgi:hypothetical protein